MRNSKDNSNRENKRMREKIRKRKFMNRVINSNI